GAYEVVSLSRILPWPLVAMRLRKLLHDRFIQVVVVNGDREQLIAAVAARLAERAAVLRRVATGQRMRQSRFERLAFRYAPTGLVFSSEEDRRNAPPTALTRFPAAVVPLGVNAHAYDAIRPASRASIGAPGGTRLLVCVYDRSGRARAATVLRVIGLLAPRHPELRLALVGAGSNDEDLRMHAAALRITGAVSFLRARRLSLRAERSRSRMGGRRRGQRGVRAARSARLASAGARRTGHRGGAVRARW